MEGEKSFLQSSVRQEGKKEEHKAQSELCTNVAGSGGKTRLGVINQSSLAKEYFLQMVLMTDQQHDGEELKLLRVFNKKEKGAFIQ